MRETSSNELSRFWWILITLLIFLALMVKFPLRIFIGESLFDSLFYGPISLMCVVFAQRIYSRFGDNSHRLLLLLLLCSLLAGWQVFDLIGLRYESSSVHGFGPEMSTYFTEYDGLAWYNPRFQNNRHICDVGFIYERYYGNKTIAITVEIRRGATWFACGG